MAFCDSAEIDFHSVALKRLCFLAICEDGKTKLRTPILDIPVFVFNRYEEIRVVEDGRSFRVDLIVTAEDGRLEVIDMGFVVVIVFTLVFKCLACLFSIQLEKRCGDTYNCLLYVIFSGVFCEKQV